MALSDTSKINISIKKLSGKAQTSNDKDLANEGLPTGLTLSAETIFGDSIPTSPTKGSLYDTTAGTVEYLRLSASFIAGTDTSSGRHAFALKLPDNYESNSSNSKAGTYPFINSQVIYITSGALQLVPTSFSTNYEAVPYHTGSGETSIPVLDARDWNLDYFNGIFFQQDPPATGDSNQNPRYVDAFLYIGSSVKDRTASGNGDPNAQYLVLSATGSLPNERVFTPGLGIDGVDAGVGSSYTLKIKDSIVATLTGSQFSGNVGITGSFGVTSTSIFGNGSSLSGADNNFFVSGAIGSRGTTIKGTSVFGGDVVISGSLYGGSPLTIGDGIFVTGSSEFSSGLSGSLTKLTDGTSYLIAGSGISIASASGGPVTITGTAVSAEWTDEGDILRPNDGVGEQAGFGSTGNNPASYHTLIGSGSIKTIGFVTASMGFSGSLTRLPDGSSYLVAGNSISISSASNGSITVGFISPERVKSDRLLDSVIFAGQDCDISANFSSANYSFNKVDIFVNGQLMISGSSRDYMLNTSKTGSIRFNFDLLKNDIVVSVVNT